MTSKLCCLVNPHVKCTLCNEVFCREHWSADRSRPEFLPHNKNTRLYCPTSGDYLEWTIGSQEVMNLGRDHRFPLNLSKDKNEKKKE